MVMVHIRFPVQLANQRVASFGMDFECATGTGASEIQDMVDAATTEWLTKVGLFAVDCELQPAQAQSQERVHLDIGGPNDRWVRQPTSTEFTGAGAAAAGTVAGQSSSPGTALVVTLRSAAPGRRARGRVYTPPPPESLIDGAGQVSDAAARATMVQDLASEVEGAVVGLDIDHVVWSVTYGDTNEVISYTTNGIADYQRRRARQLS